MRGHVSPTLLELEDASRVTRAWPEAHRAAAAALLPQVYEELRLLAAAWFRRQSPAHTLQPTALVHEAYARIAAAQHPGDADALGEGPPGPIDRTRFFALAARVMRQVLVDHHRKRGASKRGGPGRAGDPAIQRTRLDIEHVADHTPSSATNGIDVLVLDEALQRLTALDERKGRVVELRFFAGLTNEAIASVLGVSRTTVDSDWQVARAWLRTELRSDLP